MQNFYEKIGVKPKEVSFTYEDQTFTMRPVSALAMEEIRSVSAREAKRKLADLREELEAQNPDLIDYTTAIAGLSPEQIEASGIEKPKTKYDEVFVRTSNLHFGLICGAFGMHKDGSPIVGTVDEANQLTKSFPMDFIKVIIQAFTDVNALVTKNANASASLVSSEEKIPA